MKTKAYAKINLGLNVYPSNDHKINKHKLETIMFLIDSIYDDIEINASGKDSITYKRNNKESICEDCLIIKVLNYLKQKFNIKNNYEIVINKRIPIGSGLGGGSSDAASVIKTILRLENIDIKALDFYDIAINLGSDIPFFLTDFNIAYVSNYGDKIEELDFKVNFDFNVHLLDVEVNTHRVFKNLTNDDFENLPKNNFKEIIATLKNGGFNLNIVNNLQESCFEIFPEVKEKFDELSNKHLFCILSGSGSSLITINSSVANCLKVRTRYAPSPTGYFHIGGARTAIFNYLFAKHYNGDFILRIEDTDIERNVEGGIESQIENLEWMGISPDESFKKPNVKCGPYIQSEKLEKYQELAQKLVDEKKAYYCFCSKEELEQEREKQLANHQTPKYQRKCLHLSEKEIQNKLNQNIPYVIRLKMEDDINISWFDLIRGEISVPTSALTDPVILKANKVAMYNFAVVIDDYDMEITHVLRGEEHISNTPYQLAIAKALNKKLSINYGHLSIIVDETGKKLSKRNKDLKQFISDYKQAGCIPEALFNFLSLLGFSPKSNKEKLSANEFVSEFDYNCLSKSPSFFDEKKLLWLANEYMKSIDDSKYLEFVKSFVKQEYQQMLATNLNDVLLVFKNQISFAVELNDLINEYFIESKKLTDEEKSILEANNDVVEFFSSQIKNTKEWTIDSITSLVNETKKATNKKGKDLFMPIRLLCTNMSHGPELAKIIYFLGQQKVINNIEQIIKK